VALPRSHCSHLVPTARFHVQSESLLEFPQEVGLGIKMPISDPAFPESLLFVTPFPRSFHGFQNCSHISHLIE
jgi:hypothetical protein